MFGWISSVFNSVSGTVTDAVRSFVNTLIRTLYGYLHTIFGLVGDEWRYFWGSAALFVRGIHTFADAVWRFASYLRRVTIPWLANWINALTKTLLKLIRTVVSDLTHLIDSVYHKLLALLDALKKWVITDVWNPLIAWVKRIWDWITKVGATMWFYFTHLPAFAGLLFWHIITSLERHAWDAAKLLGRFFLSLIVHNLVQFVTLVEDIISEIL